MICTTKNLIQKDLLGVLRAQDHNTPFKIDCIAKKQGHKILRLLPFHCIFNPIELVWSELKAHVRRNNTAPKFTANTINVIKEEVSKITPASWSTACVM